MRDNKKDKASATIVDLVAKDDAGKEAAARSGRAVRIKDRLRMENMLVPGSGLEQSYLDQYRRIKRPLLANAFGKSSSLVEKGNLILVTSSMPGEGKTFTAINLALSIAQERDHTVLLVDADVTRKGTSHKLGLQNRTGLIDVLADESKSIGDVMLKTDIPELTVITAGKHDEYVTEFLASERMAHIVDEIAARYEDRVIVFDGPPLLPTPQTQVVAGLVGQVAFVIESGNTPQALVEEAIELLPSEKAIGLIMNKNEGYIDDRSYYYGYYAQSEDS